MGNHRAHLFIWKRQGIKIGVRHPCFTMVSPIIKPAECRFPAEVRCGGQGEALLASDVAAPEFPVS